MKFGPASSIEHDVQRRQHRPPPLAVVGNFLLAATAHGVATVAQAALSRHARTIREVLGIGDDRRMVCGVSFGYAMADHPVNVYRTERAGLDEVLRWIAD